MCEIIGFLGVNGVNILGERRMPGRMRHWHYFQQSLSSLNFIAPRELRYDCGFLRHGRARIFILINQ